ncbi:MAG: UbiA family prenyltransferase [Kiritimatiellae bacterium]|nr:UbiA family prenyltransferase [Kiritimatiellia bacterium]
MAAAFFLGNALVALVLAKGSVHWPSMLPPLAATVLIFFRLRIFDELKDYETDKALHPDRPLARGLISTIDAKRMALTVAVLELALAAASGPCAFAAWGVVLLFSLLMYREFFAGAWLRPKMELYAVSHTLVSGWIGLYIATAVSGMLPWRLPAGVWAFALANWAVFNVFEFARKTWARDEETPGIESYSGRLQPWGAALLTLSMVAGSALGLYAVVTRTAAADAARILALVMAAIPTVIGLVYTGHPRGAAGPLFRRTMEVYIVAYYLVLVGCILY